MVRTLPVLVVTVLLVFASTVAAVPSATPADRSPNSTTTDGTSLQTASQVTRGLQLETVGASNITTAETDTSSLLDVQSSDLQSTFETYRLEERMNSVDSRDTRREILRQEISNVSSRLDKLRADEREARLAYIEGDLSGSEFVVALARISAEAESTDAKLTHIEQTVGDTFPKIVSERVPPLQPQFEALQGPVRGHAVDVLRGDARSNQLYIAASANGTRLSMIKGRILVSQTTRWDNFDPAVDSITNRETVISSAVNETHPELDFSKPNTYSGFTVIGPNQELYRVAPITFEYGKAFGYFDGSTKSLFYEEQELFLDSLPRMQTEQQVQNDTILTVNRTYAGGPLKISLTNETGTALDGEVLIDGESVGSTGFDGLLWTLDRPGAYNVTVVHEDERIRIEAPRATFDD